MLDPGRSILQRHGDHGRSPVTCKDTQVRRRTSSDVHRGLDFRCRLPDGAGSACPHSFPQPRRGPLLRATEACEEACGSRFFPSTRGNNSRHTVRRRRFYVHVIVIRVSEQDAFCLFTLRHSMQWCGVAVIPDGPRARGPSPPERRPLTEKARDLPRAPGVLGKAHFSHPAISRRSSDAVLASRTGISGGVCCGPVRIAYSLPDSLDQIVRPGKS